MPEDDSPQCSCCIIFPTAQESETRKNKGLAGLSVAFLFRLNFQLGKCEFSSDDKGRGTDIVRCCFRNDKLLSVPDCHLPRPGVNPEQTTGAVCLSWLSKRSHRDDNRPVEPAWSLGHRSWTLRAVKPLQMNQGPPRLGYRGGRYCGDSPCTDLSAAAGGLETPGTCLLCPSIVHVVGQIISKSIRLVSCLQDLPGFRGAQGVSTAAKLAGSSPGRFHPGSHLLERAGRTEPESSRQQGTLLTASERCRVYITMYFRGKIYYFIP